MKIYTSYFAKAKALQEAGIITVSIARFNPRFAKVDVTYKELAPTKEMLKMSKEDYLVHFQQILHTLKRKDVLGSLEQVCKEAGKNEIALLCYETPSDFCHRHLVADWLNDDIDTLWYFCDEKVTEWKPKEKGLFA